MYRIGTRQAHMQRQLHVVKVGQAKLSDNQNRRFPPRLVFAHICVLGRGSDKHLLVRAG